MAAYIVFVGIFFVSRDWFYEWGHGCAAGTLFVAMLLAIGANAHDARGKGKPGTAAFYIVVDAIAVVLIAVIFLLPGEVPTRVFWIEAVGIAAFAIFWLAQTLELRRNIIRRSVMNPKGQVSVMLH